MRFSKQVKWCKICLQHKIAMKDVIFRVFSLICQCQESITRDLLTIISPLSYITLDKFIRSGLYWIASHDGKTRLRVLLSRRCRNRLPCTRHLLSDLKILSREARGSLSSSLISNQAHREPMNNPDDISPTLNRHTSGRIVVVIHRLLAPVPSLLCNYFLSETTAGIWPSVREHHACHFEGPSHLHAYWLYASFETSIVYIHIYDNFTCNNISNIWGILNKVF